jgi:hypothetical protein
MSSSERNWAMRESSRTASKGGMARLYPSVLLIVSPLQKCSHRNVRE